MSAADEVVGDDEGGDEGSDDKGGGGDESGDGVVEVGVGVVEEGDVDDAEQVAPGEPGGHHRLLTGGPPKQSGKPPCRK